jgi:peroxidase
MVSDAIFDQTTSIPSAIGLSDYIWTWGQFLDHDFSLTEGAREAMPISVPPGDPFFDPFFTNLQTISFRRALFDPSTGTSSPREQVNEITGYIDGSNVYGSTPERAAWLRTGSGGRLKVTDTPVGTLLPFNDGTQPNAGSPEAPDLSTSSFLAGDVRANEQPTLACLHTLFVREHNRQAARIQRADHRLSDEEIYQHARRIVIGEIEAITYREFLPALLGPDALGPDGDYDPTVNAGIATVFSTAAYRLGHTLLSPMIQRRDAQGNSIPEGPLALREAFFAATPPILEQEGLEPILRGLAAQRAQELDAHIIDDVRNFLFGAPRSGGLDLISLNLQRGRDLGLPDFNTVRADYGLPRKQTFSDITSDPATATKLEDLYGDVDDIDVFVGLLVEDDLPGRIVGETLMAVLVDQFTRSRAGDRFWYSRLLPRGELNRVHHTRLSTVIRHNTTIQRIQPNVFFVRKHPGARD